MSNKKLSHLIAAVPLLSHIVPTPAEVIILLLDIILWDVIFCY